VGRWCRFRKAVSALVVKEDAVVARKALYDLVPDAEIRAERIGKNQRRLGCVTAHLVMQNNAVYACKRHRASSLPATYYRVCCNQEIASIRLLSLRHEVRRWS